MSVVQEFKTFISRGSVIDLAIGVVIGGAFGKIVSSFVEDIILPPISLLTSGVNLSEAGIVLKEAAKAGDPVIAIRYGNFFRSSFSFSSLLLPSFSSSRLSTACGNQRRLRRRPRRSRPMRKNC